MADSRSSSQYRDGFEDGLEPLEALDLNRVQGFADLLEAYSRTAFGARRLGDAFSVMEAMAKDPACFVVCTLSGAMTVAKMGLVLCEMIERGYIDLIVSTGALQAHGMVEGTGMHHFRYDPRMDDKTLFDRGYDRVYDTLELEKNLDQLEEIARGPLASIPGGQPVGSNDICRLLGKALQERFPNSRGVLKSAYEHNVPVFIPAFTDSELGLDIAVNNRLRQTRGEAPVSFDPFKDLDQYTDLIREHESLGIFTIGGGVPRNWAQQVGPYLEISHLRVPGQPAVPRRFRYGVRICPASEHWGGLSGCTYSEGTSWGKFVPPSEGGQYAEVLCDATLVWPILVKALMERVPHKTKSPSE